jgi:O-antigen ligase
METIPLPHDQLDTPSSTHAILKIAGAVFTALVTWFFVATVINLALRAWWPHYHEAETAFNFTFAMKLTRLALGAISSLSAGLVAAWLGKGRMRAATFTGIVLLGLFVPGHYRIWDKFPVWYHLTFLVSLLPLTLLGAVLNHRAGRKAP